MCDLCERKTKIQFRVKTKYLRSWTFICPECWESVSKQENYKYGGTRKKIY